MHADGIFQSGHVWAGQFVCRGIFQCGLDSLYVEKYSSVHTCQPIQFTSIKFKKFIIWEGYGHTG